MRILIVEDSVLLREGLVRLLEHSGHQVAAALPDTTELFTTIDTDMPDLAILDVRLPPTWSDEGIRAAITIRERYPELPLLVLSQYVEERYASELISTHTSALGYLLKDRVADVTEFVESLEQIRSGGTILDPEVVAQLLTRTHHDDRMQRLTDRERTVLAAVAEGKSNQAIAKLLHLSEASVEKHITAIFQKLELEADGTGNRRVLAALAHIESQSAIPQPRQDKP